MDPHQDDARVGTISGARIDEEYAAEAGDDDARVTHSATSGDASGPTAPATSGDSSTNSSSRGPGHQRRASMADKLARMRSQRGNLLSISPSPSDSTSSTPAGSSLSSSSPPLLSDLVATTATGTTTTTLSSAASTYTESPHEAHDDMAHYFAIETRLALKERLQGLQVRLEPLLTQTKLAWMRCFALDAPDAPTPDADHDPGTTLDRAVGLVTQGETVATLLTDAIRMARAKSCPINAYRDAVTRVEDAFADLERVVQAIATAPPSPAKVPVAQRQWTATSGARGADDNRATPTGQDDFRRHVSIDLPSMKTYVDRVAPPYASYLTSKKHRKARKHE